MKTLLVAAGLLMAGASVYGLADYNKKAASKEFKQLYNENPAPEEPAKKEVVPVVEKKESTRTEALPNAKETPVKKAVKKKTAKKKKTERVFTTKAFSRGRLG